MAKRVIFLAVAVILVRLIDAAVETKEIYFLKGEPLTISPEPQTKPITSITWRNKDNLVTEWIKDQIDLHDFGDFKGRTKLNLTTGILTITTANALDKGLFTVEINNVDQSVRYNAVMLKKVPKPAVILRPLTCQQTSETCYLTCEGDVSSSHGPVTYLWKEGDLGWAQSEKDMNITNDEKTQGIKTYLCKMKNPLSEGESDAFDNVFYKPPGSNAGIIITVLVFIVIIIAGGIFAYCKRDYLRTLLARTQTSNNQSEKNEANPDSGETDHLSGDTQDQS